MNISKHSSGTNASKQTDSNLHYEKAFLYKRIPTQFQSRIAISKFQFAIFYSRIGLGKTAGKKMNCKFQMIMIDYQCSEATGLSDIEQFVP